VLLNCSWLNDGIDVAAPTHFVGQSVSPDAWANRIAKSVSSTISLKILFQWKENEIDGAVHDSPSHLKQLNPTYILIFSLRYNDVVAVWLK
jgi:hypothetical protein